MAKNYYTVLTTYGSQQFATAIANNRPLSVTHFAVGDGNGRTVQPDSARTTLVREVHRSTISSISLDPRNNKQVVFELTLPETVGGFWIREMGLFDSTGRMVAHANCPDSFKPRLEENSGKVQILRMILLISSSNAVTLTVDNRVIWATRGQLTPKKLTATTRNEVQEDGHTHEIERASLTQAGITQLNASIQSTSTSEAATPSAVKAAYDKATAAEQLAQTKQDALVRHRLDLTALDAGLYHLVTFSPTGALKDGRRWSFQISRPLPGLGRVTWATHSSGGFSLQVGWSSNARDWGANGLYREVEYFEYALTPQSPIIGIGQNVNASVEYCYLRGGSVYFADALAGFEVVVQTEAVTRNGITLAPSREFDARLVPVVDLKQAREVVTEAVRHKNLDSLMPGSDIRWDRATPRELPNGTYMGLGRRAILNVDDGTYTGWQMVSRAQEAWHSVRFGANNNRLFFQQAKSETEWREPVEMLFARPQTAWNLNDILVIGVYPQADQSLATTARNYPIAQPGQLWVTPWGDTLQQRYVATGGETFQRQRIGNTGTQWSRWTRVDGADWAEIRNRPWNVEANIATRNLNEITNFGLYGQVVDANATAERNYPERSGGTLLVTPSAYGVLQEYTTWYQNKKYVRGRDGNGWRPWRRVDSQDCVAKGGDTMTGNLQLSVGDYSFINQYNTAGKHARIETLPDRESNFYRVSYWEGLNDLYAAFFPKRGKYETVAYESWVNQLLAANFTRSWYPDHYAGTEVYKARQWGLMITVMNTTAANKDVELPEAYTGHAIVIASDRGDGRISLSGSRFLGGNRIRLTGRNDTHCHVLVIGSIG